MSAGSKNCFKKTGLEKTQNLASKMFTSRFHNVCKTNIEKINRSETPAVPLRWKKAQLIKTDLTHHTFNSYKVTDIASIVAVQSFKS